MIGKIYIVVLCSSIIKLTVDQNTGIHCFVVIEFYWLLLQDPIRFIHLGYPYTSTFFFVRFSQTNYEARMTLLINIYFFFQARIHLLVIPNEFIADLKCINNTHLPLLKHMLKIGKEISEKQVKSFLISSINSFNKYRTAAKANARGSFANFRYGYHAIPSMSHLHMHVISQDFISDSLKTVCIFISIGIHILSFFSF